MTNYAARMDAIHDRQDRAWKERPFTREERLASIKHNAWQALIRNPQDFHAEDAAWLVQQIEALETEMEEVLAYSRSKQS